MSLVPAELVEVFVFLEYLPVCWPRNLFRHEQISAWPVRFLPVGAEASGPL